MTRHLAAAPAPTDADDTTTPVDDETTTSGGAIWSRREIEALLLVGRSAANADVHDVLVVIAQEACKVAGAQSASIVLITPDGGLRLAVSIGLSDDYNTFLDSHVARHRRGLSQDALQRLSPIVVTDIQSDPRVTRSGARDWRRFAQRENYRAALSVPLVAGGRPVGALNVYRATAGPWASQMIEMLVYFARHAGSALKRAALLETQRRQVDALERIVHVLRSQTQEYANRLQTLSGMLATDDIDNARSYLASLMAMHHENSESVVDRLHDPIVAGLVLALIESARRQQVDVRLHRGSRLDSLPPTLLDAEAVSIIANLVVNAVEAVVGLPRVRRRVTLRIVQTPDAVNIGVRDWGCGLPAATSASMFAKGASSKRGHAGVGLTLVSDAVEAARGHLSVRSHRQGTTFEVVVPYPPST